MDMASEPTAVVESYLKAFNDQDADRLRSVLAEDVIEHGIHATVSGVASVIDRLDRHHTVFPDYTGTSHEIMADGEIVCVRYSASGTHTGEYHDIEPTGLKATWTGMAMYRIKDGHIAEIWLEEDRLGLLEQLQFVAETEPAHLRI